MNFSGNLGVNSTYGTLDEEGVLSKDVREVVEGVVVLAMLPLIMVGIATNVINIRVFAAQGIWNDNTNFGFISLSVFDLLNCATLVPFSLCYVLKTTHDVPDHRTCVAFSTTFLFAHSALQLSSSWTTVYMSVVKSFCVYIPLKVKRIFTPKVGIVVIMTQFLFFLVIQLVYDAFTEIVWVVDPQFNKSFAYVIDSPVIQDYLYYTTIMNYQILAVISILIVSVTTSLMVYKLFQVRKWRQKNASISSSSGNPETRNTETRNTETRNETNDKSSTDKKPLASKDIELMKSVIIVTAIFMVCVSMSYIPAIVTIILPGVSFSGVNRNLFYVVFLIRFLFDAINSSINFFFYIRISSRYKTTFASVFPCCLSHKAL